MHDHLRGISETTPIVVRRTLFWGAAVLICGAFFGFFYPGIGWNEPRASFAELLSGTAHRPFAYRVLIPGLSGALHRLAPVFDPQAIATVLNGLALLGFVGALRLLCNAYWPLTPQLELAVLLAPLALLPLALTFRHVYDLPTLCFFTLGLALLAHRRWNAFLLVYAIGCLNKETTLFLTPVFLLWYGSEWRTPSFQRVLVAQLVVYGLIRVGLMWRFAANPGGVVEFHLWDHLRVYGQLPGFAAFYAGMVAIIALLAVRNGRGKPRRLQGAAGLLVAILTPLFVLFGFPFELRIFYEAFAPIYLICLPAWVFRPGSAEPAQPSSA